MLELISILVYGGVCSVDGDANGLLFLNYSDYAVILGATGGEEHGA
jgi:hypothetical protein